MRPELPVSTMITSVRTFAGNGPGSAMANHRKPKSQTSTMKATKRRNMM